MQKLNFDADTWTQLNRLLDEALDQPPASRTAWIETLGPDAERLKPHLRELLSRAASVETGEFLNTLPKFDVAPPTNSPAVTTPPAGQPGEVIGQYRLLRELGRGGMGSVWLAERVDGLIQRPVALKLPHGSWRRAGLAERMAREREILASLDHRNIARLFDAGIGADGQPYLALEYVEGASIDAYCRDRGDGTPARLEQRLRLFLQVANAVAYAHGKLVIHRDIKPANILVTGNGGVRLLDFGIAKLLDEGEARETHLTELSGRALTPDYASPEQVLGEPLAVTSDIYSLGVVLYELLTDTRPYKLKRESRGAVEEAILHAEPARPSVTAPGQLRRALRGDLDTIVLKALKKRPPERYATVNALAEDIERYLDHRPVLAQPDNAWYRVRKFVVRNQLAVGAGSAVVIAVLAGALAAAWQAKLARIQGTRAAEVSAFIVSIFNNADPHRGDGKSLSAVELLRQAKGRLDATTVADPHLRLELANALGESMLGVEDAQGAVSVLDPAIAVADRFADDTPQTARAHRLHARALSVLGRGDDALREIDAVIAGLEGRGPQFRDEFVEALLVRAAALNHTSRYAEAHDTAKRALDSLGPEERNGLRSIEALLIQSHASGYLLKNEEALEQGRAAYDLARTLYRGNDTHPIVNAARMEYAVALAGRDDVDGAIDLMFASRDDAARLFGRDSRIVGQYQGSMIQYLVAAGRVADAVATSNDAIRILEPLLEPGGLSHAALLDSRGLALASARRAAEALEATTRARDLVFTKLGEEHESAFVLTVHRGRELALLGRLDEARRDLQWVIDRYARAGKSTLSTPLYHLGFVQRLSGEAAAAVETQKRALSTLRPGPRARRSSARILVELGLARLDAADLAGARESLGEAEKIYTEIFRHRPPEYADALLGLGRIELRLGSTSNALRHLAAADEIWRSLEADTHWAGEAAHWLGRAQLAAGDRAAASKNFVRAEPLLAASPLAVHRALP